jgi:hypothetical protein
MIKDALARGLQCPPLPIRTIPCPGSPAAGTIGSAAGTVGSAAGTVGSAAGTVGNR